MRAVDEFAADSPDVCAEAPSIFSCLTGIRSRLEATRPRKAKTSDAYATHREIASAATRRDVVKARGAGKFHIASTAPKPRAGRVAANEIIALNHQGANSRRVA
jgi:hypothetical protein